MPVIVILGGGFAGMAVARRLERRLRPEEAEIVVLSREELLALHPDAARGDAPAISKSVTSRRRLREQFRRVASFSPTFDEIDVGRTLVVVVPYVLPALSSAPTYDHLVLALGASTSTFGLPGVAEHALGA